MPITGKQLRKLRRTKDVTVVAVAARMGLSRQALWALERAAEVNPDRADQYRQAVRDVTEPTPSAEAVA